jgi:vacuolar-type H+-ATPase subunit I/STV1
MAFPQLQKDDRERRAREQAEREKRHQIWEHNQSISRNQRQQYEEAIKEATKYRELQLLDDYLLKVEAEATKLNQIEGEVANFWLKVVRAHAENESPLNKRIAHLKKLASPVKSSWEGMWMAGEIKE